MIRNEVVLAVVYTASFKWIGLASLGCIRSAMGVTTETIYALDGHHRGLGPLSNRKASLSTICPVFVLVPG